MATTQYLNTPPANYALGRNSIVTLTFNNPDLTSSAWKTVSMELCISQGQVSMETDTIEIPSNCQSGWKIKLPGLIGGTVTGTGYIASSSITASGFTQSTPGAPLDLLQFLSQPAAVNIVAATQVVQGAQLVEDDPFVLDPPAANPINGFFKSSNLSISPDDAVKLDFTIELSGAQSITGFVAIAQAVSS